MTTSHVEVWLWGRHIASLAADSVQRVSFRYVDEFVSSGIQVSPFLMPLGNRIFDGFERRNDDTFKGLPPLVIDSLPDKFGEALIRQWMARQGRGEQLTPLERLCYTGNRGMGALEFIPATERPEVVDEALDVAQLVELASQALRAKEGLSTGLEDAEDFAQILSVGTSAGGARAKAVIAFNPDTGEVRSGQASNLPDGFEHWLLKFDGVDENRDKELADPLGFGRIEFAYSAMAKAAGIEMMQCQLLEEGPRAHFMTKRFDRTGANGKLHYASLCAIAGYDFNMPQGTAYEEAFLTMRGLGLGFNEIIEQVRRCIFNIVARNQDDHTKNIGYLMGRDGVWSLSPAFDITFSYNPSGAWTSQHQMTLAGKSNDWDRPEIIEALATSSGMDARDVSAIIDHTVAVVGEWMQFAEDAGVERNDALARQNHFRLTSLGISQNL